MADAGGEPTVGRRRLDPDELAELEERRNHLLGSIDDLEAEYAAGDIDEVDYEALSDDYTRRAAETIRAIEQREAAFRAVRRERDPRRLALSIGAVVLVAVVAGVFLARASGFRSPGDLSTGDVRGTNRELLLEAGALGAEGQFSEAIVLYDEVLETQPSSAEAHAYKGWFLYRSGDVDDALPSLDDAVAADGTYADARVFRAIVFNDLGRYDDAADELEAFAGSDPPPAMVELVEGNRLAERVLAGMLTTAAAAGGVEIDAIGATPDDVARAGRFTDPAVAVEVYTAVLDVDATNVIALTYRGQLFTLTGDPDAVAGGLTDLDRAIEIDPEYPDARLWRAAARLALGDIDSAEEDLDVFEALDPSPELVAIAADAGLRDRIDELQGS